MFCFVTLLYFQLWLFFSWFRLAFFGFIRWRGLREWAKKGVFEIYISGMLHGVLILHSIFRECGETWGTENKQNGTWSSLTCIISFFLSFFFLGFNGWYSHCHCMFCIMCGWVHIACGLSSSFLWKLSVSLYLYRTVLLAS